MDRRQQKTRAAIFAAFESLLAKKSYSKITVQEIIDAANVGRTTFYAHFAAKDELLKALCEDLFGHIIRSALDSTHTHGLYSDKSAPASVFCHLLHHLQENQHTILALLSCESSELFLRYFRASLNTLVQSQCIPPDGKSRASVPPDFLVNHISGSFVEMVLWWIQGRMRQTPEELDGYFRAVIAPLL